MKLLKMAAALAAGLACLIAPLGAEAQKVSAPATTVPMTAAAYGTKGATAQAVDAGHGLPVVCESGCASPVPFTPTGQAILSVTTSSARIALPNADATLLVENKGAADAAFKLGSGSVTAATTDYNLSAGHSIVIASGGLADLAAITASGTTTLSITQGTGVPQIAGGGAGGSSTASLSPWTPDNGSLITAAPTSTSSLSTAFSGSGATIYVKNIGTVPVHFRSVLTSGTALVTDERLLPGMCGPIARSTGDRLALITDSGTGSVEITTGTGNPGFGACTDMSTAAVTNPWGDLSKWGDQSTTITASTSAATCVTAPGAGVTRNIMGITLNDSAATDTVVQILNTDGTTVRWTGTAKANDQRGIVLPGPIKGSTTAVDFKCKTLTSTSSVVFTINYVDK